MNFKKPSFETWILMAIYSMVFFYCLVFQEAIFSPDTYGYINAMPERSPGYVLFSKAFIFLFPENYGFLIVVAQLVLGFYAVNYFLKTFTKILKLNWILKAVSLTILLFPFFPPLLVVNNIASEGLSYPFYLLFLCYGLEFLNFEKRYTILYLIGTYSILVLTRGQFIVTSVVIAFVYFFKYRNFILKKRYLLKFLMILMLPLLTIFADKTYHKLKDGMFISTPFSYVSMSGAAFYVAKEQDVDFIDNPEYKTLFEASYEQLEEKELLLRSKTREDFDAYYQHFHNHVPQICNQTVHEIGRNYYFKQYLERSNDQEAASVYSLWQSEMACKSMFFSIVKHNFKDYSRLYFSNLVHGYKSIVLLLFVVVVFLFSFFKVIYISDKYYQILFICSALALSNSLIVSIASHSIMRYLFYNYILLFFMGFIIIKLFLNARRD